MSLEILSVINASEPKDEVVRLIARADVKLKGYALVDKTFDSAGNTSNEFRHIFLFPDIEIKQGDYIRLYSGKGKNSTTKTTTETNDVYHMHWHADSCVWNNAGDTATLIKFTVSGTATVPAIKK